MQLAHFLRADTSALAAAYSAELHSGVHCTVQPQHANSQATRAAALLEREHADTIQIVTSAHPVAASNLPLVRTLPQLPAVAHVAACRSSVHAAFARCEVVLVDEANAVRIAQLLPSVPEATELVLRSPACAMSESAKGVVVRVASEVARYAARAPHLHTVRLDGSCAAAAVALLSHMQPSASLRMLSLRSNEIDTQAAFAASSYLALLTQLTSLNLSENALCAGGGGGPFWSALAGLTGLSELLLSDMWLHGHATVQTLPHLSTLTQLTRLVICDRAVAPDDTFALTQVLASLRRLVDLSLTGIGLAPVHAALLGTQLAALPAMKRLTLRAVPAREPEDVMAALMRELARCTGLTQLDVSYNALQNADAAQHLAALTALRVLNLAGNVLSVQAASNIGRALTELRALERLDVSSNDHFAPLVAHLAALTALTWLSAGKANEMEDTLEAAVLDVSRIPALRHLQLTNCYFHGDIACGRHLAKATTLTHLNIQRSRAPRTPCAAFSAIVLPSLRSLAHFEMSHTARLCNGEGTAALGALVHLTCVDLSFSRDCLAIASVTEALAHSIVFLDKLAHLSLRSAGLHGSALAALQRAIATRKSLTYLDLGGNDLDDDSVESLVGSLEGLQQLRHLAISAAFGAGACAVAVAESVTALAWLTHLETQGSEDGNVIAQMRPWLEQLSQLQRLIVQPAHVNPSAQVARAAALGPRLAAVAGL